MENSPRYYGVNLYVKNFDPSFDDGKLYSVFAAYGSIISVKIMRHEDGTSKGFGFVCFSNSDEANAAIRGLNGSVVYHKPLYVSLFENKKTRQEKLSSLHADFQRIKREESERASEHDTTVQAPVRGIGREQPREMLQAARYLEPCLELPVLPTTPRGRGRFIAIANGNEIM